MERGTDHVLIHVWLGNIQNVGHASMTLTDGTYISWWPSEGKSVESIKACQKDIEGVPQDSYNEDVVLESKVADRTFKIPCDRLDENKMKIWWSEFKGQNKYNLANKNCCSAVIEALKSGEVEKIVTAENLFPLPQELVNYGEKLEAKLQ